MSESASSHGSASSGASSGNASSVASDAAALNHLNDTNGDESLDDLLEQNKGLQEMVFACLYTVTRNKQQTSLWFACVRVVLEFLQVFRVIFNTSFPVWRIKKDIFIWKSVYWVLFRFLVWDKGYASYVLVFYIIASVVLLVVTLTVFAAWMLKKEDNAQMWWMKRLLSFLQLSAFVLFSLFWVSLLDYMLFLLDCHWQDEVAPHHLLWEDQRCLEMPHLGNMIFAGVMCIVFIAVTLLLSVSDTDLNPMTKNIMASPTAGTTFILLTLKIVMVVVSTALDTIPDVQPVLMIICAGAITYFLLRRAVFYHDWLNHVWVGFWCGLLFVCGLLVEGWDGKHQGQEAYLVNLTWGVLYGIFGAVAVGMLVSWLHLNKWLRRHAAVLEDAFRDPESRSRMKTVYRFKDPEQVELLARKMRKFDEDGNPDPKSADLGAFIINCGLARFPNSCEMLIRYANFLLSAKKDGQAARTQLQLAAQSSPTWLQRYFIYVSQEYAKKIKSLTEGIDLMGFIEFKRNYRACVKAHKLALMAQRRFWKVAIRDRVAYQDMQSALQHLHQVEQQAQQVYRRVLERYPNNGKLRKIYGRFQEYVRNDPWTAGSCYTEAMKQGLNDNLMGLVNGTAGKDSSDKLLLVMGGDVNEKTDGIIIIDARGTILITNPAASNMFGYAKGELEGKNVSMLMPQPFSSSHDMFLDNYVKTGQPKILDTRREVVAITKEHSISPISLGVTKLSGAGFDAIFFGLVKPTVQQQGTTVKVWATAAGTVLCVDASFTDWFGVSSEDVLGKALSSMCTQPEALDRYIQACTKLPPDQVGGGRHSIVTRLLHRYADEVDVNITVQLGGTVDQRLLVFQICCLSDPKPLFVTDGKATILHVNAQFAKFVGYSAKSLVGMSLGALVPSPVCHLLPVCLKASWVAVPPPLSCRSGAVVFFLHANNTRLPATLQLSSTTASGHRRHVVKVTPSSREAQQDQQRLLLHVNLHGVVLSTNASASKSLFGFDPTELIGRPVASAINVFAEWRKQFGEDLSLLAMLCVKAAEAGDVFVRVGVHRPVPDDEIINSTEARSQKEHGAVDVLKMLQQHTRREHAAILTIQPSISTDAGGGLDLDSLGDETPVLQLELWRPQMLSGVLDIDEKMLITDADQKAGMMFGMRAHSLLQSSVFSLLGSNSNLTARDLLCGNINGANTQGQKSMLKQGGASRVGPPRLIEAPHADGGVVKVEIQAVSKESNNSRQLQVLLRAKDDCTGSLKPLLAMAGKDKEVTAAALTHKKAETDVALSCPLRPVARHSEAGDQVFEEDDSDAASAHSGGSADVHISHKALKRTAAWVTHQALPPDDSPPLGDSEAVVEVTRKALPFGGGLHKDFKAAEPKQPPVAKPVAMEMQQAAGSVHSESEAGDAASSASGNGQDDELVPDFRRAKRLKKLVRMMTSRTAHTATESFRKTTWLVVLGLTLAHVLCFVILTTQIQARYENAYAVDAMATAADRSQLTTLRAVLLQQCFRPTFVEMQTCSASAIQSYKDLLFSNVQISKYNHQGLYLGFSDLQPFKDQRLMTYWTNTGLEEQNHLFRLENGTDIFRTAQTPLWQLGNKYIDAGQDIYFWSVQLRDQLSTKHSYHYILENGRKSIFTGYSWSLDVLVDYAWQQLGTRKTVILILVVIEVVVVQLACLLWEFVVLKMANNQAMRRFSIFLALPSATVRIMASQSCQAQEQQGNKSSTVRKSVRLFVDEGEEEAEPSAANPGKGAKSGALNSRHAMGKAAASSGRAPLGLLHKLYKQTLAKLNIDIKVNGKRMATSNSMVWRCMVPLVVWMLAVIIFSAVSLQELSGLQGPLASLNVAAHTLYRTGRVRSLLSLFAFEEDRAKVEEYRHSLQAEVDLLRKEYSILLYGGKVDRVADVSFDGTSPVGVFENQKAAHLLFMTRSCLRQDQSSCYGQTSEYYDVTHSGLDAVINRYMEKVDAFARLPTDLAWPNHTLYTDSTAIATHDMYDGMKTLQALFVTYTIGRLEQVKVLHVILLVGLIVLAVAYLLFMFVPYVRKLHVDAKAIAGLLSHLPAETGVEGVVKSVFLASVHGVKATPGSQTNTTVAQLPVDGTHTGSHAIGIGPAGYWEYPNNFQPSVVDEEGAVGRHARLQLY